MSPKRYWGILFRVLAAAVAGYVFTLALSLFTALVLPLPQRQAFEAGRLLSFIFYTVAIIWVFSVKTAWRAWWTLLLATLLAAAVSGWLMYGGRL